VVVKVERVLKVAKEILDAVVVVEETSEAAVLFDHMKIETLRVVAFSGLLKVAVTAISVTLVTNNETAY
jgi:hypothetical protein